jgi:carboxymethylenebutenolidase
MKDESIQSRRIFITTAVATGFALAVEPVSAEALHTDDDGLVAGEVKIAASGGEMPAYRAMPKGAPSPPVVIVVHEIFGVHEHIKDVCRRLAKLGYLAVAPDLYARQGDVSKLATNDAIVKEVVSKVPDAQVMADLDATAAWARSSGKGSASRLGITGFCWGGRITWLYAAHSAQVKAAIAWYGKLVGQANALQTTFPIDVAASLKAPVLGLYGAADAGIPVETVERMRAALKAAKSPSEIVLYPDAPHAFFADYRPSYRAATAADAWGRLKSWLTSHGV